MSCSAAHSRGLQWKQMDLMPSGDSVSVAVGCPKVTSMQLVPTLSLWYGRKLPSITISVVNGWFA